MHIFLRRLAVLSLFNQKARSGWTNKSFTKFLELLKDVLPKGNTLSNHNYETTKTLCPMGMDYIKIYTCRNDCILYMK